MEDIRKWLNSKRDYKEGVALFLKHIKDDRLLIRLFTEEGESPFKKEKLLSALQHYFDVHKQQSNPPKNQTSKTVTDLVVKMMTKDLGEKTGFLTKENKWSPADQRDAIEKELYDQWFRTYTEMQNLVARVGDVARAGVTNHAKKDEAGRMALRILDLDDLCESLYEKRDYYLKNKELPKEEQLMELSLDPNQWPKLLDNAGRYVRKYKEFLEADPNNEKHKLLLKKWEWAVTQYKKLLKIS